MSTNDVMNILMALGKKSKKLARGLKKVAYPWSKYTQPHGLFYKRAWRNAAQSDVRHVIGVQNRSI